ncbi:MAG: response regulator [Vicinamibacterales bacterium]
MPASPTPRVLVVDDYADATEVWALYLQSAGFAVSTAADGLEAIAQVKADPPDLVVMDLNLPGCSGIDVARALRAEPATAALPLIAVTGSADRQDLHEARRLFEVIAPKPCDPADLVAHIRRLLAGPQ